MEAITPSAGLADRYGRVATDLRVSLTDRCNLRCSYCMPAEGLDWLPGEDVLTDDEVVRLIRVGVEHLGIREVRFTGGEPLVRRGIVDIVGQVHAIDPAVEMSMTTNALGLSRVAGSLAEAGLAPGQRQPRLGPPRHVPRDHPAGPARRRRRRPRRRRRGGPRPGQGERRAAAGRQRRPGGGAAALVPRPRLRAPVHRADAVGRPARLDPRRDDHRRRDLRAAGAGVRAQPAPRSRGGARLPRSSWWTVDRRRWV